MSLEKLKNIDDALQSILVDGQDDPSSNPSSFFHKMRIIFTNITVEPIFVLYILPSTMASLATQNLSLEKACRVNLVLPALTCDGLSSRNSSAYNHTDEVIVQTVVANMMVWKNVIQSLLPALLLIFLGSWSDRKQRRKPCIIVPILDEVISCLGFFLCTYFFYQLPMECNAFFEAVPPAMTGGLFTVYMGVFSYISGVTSTETRTLRIGAINIFSNVSVTVGIALSGVLYKQIGFYGVFSLALVMYVTGIAYGVFYVKETPPKIEQAEMDGKVIKEKSFILDFFDLKHVRDTFLVAFKDGSRNRKKRICTIMVRVMVIIGPLYGERSVRYLFVRYRFGWDEIDYSLFSTIHFVLEIFGTIFTLMFFSKFLKLDDTIMGMISSVSKVLACLVFAFASNTTVFYVGVLVEVLNGTSFIAMRSIMSKLVPAEELGKINSLFGVCEALMPFVYGPLYSIVYINTIHFFPGAFFFLGALMTTPAIFIFYWLYREHKNDLREDEKEKQHLQNLLKSRSKDKIGEGCLSFEGKKT